MVARTVNATLHTVRREAFLDVAQRFVQTKGYEAMSIQDVLGQLGVTDLVDGQLRVTKISGDGLMWGTMSTLYLDGGVAVSTGANP